MKKEKNIKRTKKNKKLYLINFIKKIKYKNIIILILYILTSIILLNDLYNIIIKWACYSWFGLITGSMALVINICALEYIQERL